MDEAAFKLPRMLEADEADLPWEEGEGVRLVKPVNYGRISARQPAPPLQVHFNCAALPDICVSICPEYG